MGFDSATSSCKECIPDFLQEPGSSECGFQCSGKYRILGDDKCLSCPDGSYFNSRLDRLQNDPSTWDDPRCSQCSPGEYVSKNVTAFDRCFECIPGTYQPYAGATSCNACPIGSFQIKFNQTECEECAAGGYCDATDQRYGGFTPCPAGTYNDKTGQTNITSCQQCPAGTHSTILSANSSDVCLDCLPGTYSDQPGALIFAYELFSC